MRCTSAAEIKGQHNNRKKDKPQEGSQLRRLFDLLMTGEWINGYEIFGRPCGSMVRQLEYFYGLEVETIRKKGTRCTGVWEGPDLVAIERYFYATELDASQDRPTEL